MNDSEIPILDPRDIKIKKISEAMGDLLKTHKASLEEGLEAMAVCTAYLCMVMPGLLPLFVGAVEMYVEQYQKLATVQPGEKGKAQ